MNKYKKLSLLIIIPLLSLYGAVFFINLIVDPFQIWSKDYKDGQFPDMSRCQRFFNAGLIKNYSDDCDSLLIGTSLTEKFSVDYMKEKLNWQTLQLTISGGSILEVMKMTQAAINTNKVIKNVLFDYHYDSMIRPANAVDGSMILFDDDRLNDYSIFLSWTALKYSYKKLTLEPTISEIEYDDIPVNKSVSKSTDELKSLVAFVKNKHLKLSVTKKMNNIKMNIEENIKVMAENNPTVQFHIFHPPYHLLFYETLDISVHEYSKKLLFELSQKYKNIHIHDFQKSFISITNEASNYKDLIHYHEDINKLMINEIARNIK